MNNNIIFARDGMQELCSNLRNTSVLNCKKEKMSSVSSTLPHCKLLKMTAMTVQEVRNILGRDDV